MIERQANYYIKCKYDKIYVHEEKILRLRTGEEIIALQIDLNGGKKYISGEALKLFERAI